LIEFSQTAGAAPFCEASDGNTLNAHQLSAARERLGLSPSEMARACNVNRTHYAAWESDRKRMSPLAVRVVELLLAHPRTAKRFARETE